MGGGGRGNFEGARVCSLGRGLGSGFTISLAGESLHKGSCAVFYAVLPHESGVGFPTEGSEANVDPRVIEERVEISGQLYKLPRW